MLELTIKAENPVGIRQQLFNLLSLFVDADLKEEQPKPVERVEEAPPMVEVPREPVITQAQMEENIKNAPVHEEPEVPTIEEVRAVLKELRDQKGAAAVKALLKNYGADNLMELKPEDYLGAIARAKTEV